MHGALRRTAERVEPVLARVALAAAIVALAIYVRAQRGTIVEVASNLAWRQLLVATLAFAVAPLAQGLSFWIALRQLNGLAPLRETMLVWSRSYVVRYAPTGALAIAYRVNGRRRMNATAEQVVAAYGYEHVATLAAGAVACLTAFAAMGRFPPTLPLVIAAGVLLLTLLVRPSVSGRLLTTLGRRLGLRVSAVLPGRILALLVAVNALGWLGTGTAVYVLVAPLADRPGFFWLASAYTAAYLIGFVAPLAPGGIGAREGALVVLLGPRLGAAPALAASLAVRLVNVAGELVAVALVHAVCAVSYVTRGVAVDQSVSPVTQA